MLGELVTASVEAKCTCESRVEVSIAVHLLILQLLVDILDVGWHVTGAPTGRTLMTSHVVVGVLERNLWDSHSR